MEKSCTLAEFKDIAGAFAGSLSLLPERATVIGLYGGLGAGKTTFVQFVAKSFNIDSAVVSPTFLILKRYGIEGFGFKNFIHIDAYRLKSGDDLNKLGFQELLKDRHNLILIEWADRVADILPKNHIKIYFEFVSDEIHKIKLQ